MAEAQIGFALHAVRYPPTTPLYPYTSDHPPWYWWQSKRLPFILIEVLFHMIQKRPGVFLPPNPGRAVLDLTAPASRWFSCK